MEHKPLRWRLIAFGALVRIGFAGNVWQCVRLIGETEGVLVITVTSTVGTVIGIGVLGYLLDPFDRWKAERERRSNS